MGSYCMAYLCNINSHKCNKNEKWANIVTIYPKWVNTLISRGILICGHRYISRRHVRGILTHCFLKQNKTKKMLKVEGECFYHYMCQELTALISGFIRWQHSYVGHCLQELLSEEDQKFQSKQQKMETTTTDMRGGQKVQVQTKYKQRAQNSSEHAPNASDFIRLEHSIVYKMYCKHVSGLHNWNNLQCSLKATLYKSKGPKFFQLGRVFWSTSFVSHALKTHQLYNSC